MRMKDTQINAWNGLQDTITEKQKKVLVEILKSPATLFELANRLNWPINRVSGRVTELAKLGTVIDSGDRKVNPASGKLCVVWAYSKENEELYIPIMFKKPSYKALEEKIKALQHIVDSYPDICAKAYDIGYEQGKLDQS